MSWQGAMQASQLDCWYMQRAIQLAERGRGSVEPNPMVGCVIVGNSQLADPQQNILAEGWHQQFGGPHAEVVALRAAAGPVRGATAYVSLEPCCHQGKTPPCTTALIEAGIRRVVVAQQDPFARVAGGGIRALREAQLQVQVGVLEQQAQRLNAPYLKLIRTGRPWIVAKWAMTLDGKLAARTGHSRWISCPASRALVQQLRSRVDAILIGRGTAQADDPLLIARPAGPRVATRIVADSLASLDMQSQLVRTAHQAPLLLAISTHAPPASCQRLAQVGCEMLCCPGDTHVQRLAYLLDQLGRRRMTNVLVEGGSRLLGTLWDAGQIDEVHVFIAPKLIGGVAALTPVAGTGLAQIPDHPALTDIVVQQLGDDIHVHGRVNPR